MRRSRRATISATSRSRPKKNSPSSTSKRRQPLEGADDGVRGSSRLGALAGGLHLDDADSRGHPRPHAARAAVRDCGSRQRRRGGAASPPAHSAASACSDARHAPAGCQQAVDRHLDARAAHVAPGQRPHGVRRERSERQACPRAGTAPALDLVATTSSGAADSAAAGRRARPRDPRRRPPRSAGAPRRDAVSPVSVRAPCRPRTSTSARELGDQPRLAHPARRRRRATQPAGAAPRARRQWPRSHSSSRLAPVQRRARAEFRRERRSLGAGSSSAGSWRRMASCNRRSSGPGSTPICVHERRLGRLGRPPARRLGGRTGTARASAAAVQPLAQGLARQQRLDLDQHLGVTAGREVVVDGQLGRAHAQLLEAPDGGARERFFRDVGQRIAAPQRQCLPRPRRVQQSFEAPRVDLPRGQPELVAAPVGDDLRRVPVPAAAGDGTRTSAPSSPRSAAARHPTDPRRGGRSTPCDPPARPASPARARCLRAPSTMGRPSRRTSTGPSNEMSIRRPPKRPYSRVPPRVNPVYTGARPP